MTLQIRNTALLLFLPLTIYSQSISEIDVTGNSVFSDNEIILWSELSIGIPIVTVFEDSIKTKLSGNLSSQGYLHSSVVEMKIEISPDSQEVKLSLNIDEGSPTIIENVYFTSSDTSDLQIYSEVFKYLKGEILNSFDLEIYINELLSELENSGYPFAVVTIQSVYLYDGEEENEHYADLHLQLTQGNDSKIDRVEVSGNTSTKDYVIVRELRIDAGEKYSQSKIDNLPKRLNKLRFFEPVSIPSFYLDSENKGVLLINVKEKNTNNIDGIIGYVPPASDNESGYVTGLVNISLRNIFGTGRAAAIRWQKLDRSSQELELKYLEPWLFGYPFNINAGLFQRIQDSTYVQRLIEGSLEYLATEDISASATIASEEVIPTIRDVPVFTVYNSTALITGVSLKIDLRDDPISPTFGFFFGTGYSFSRKKINGPEEYLTPDLERNINLQRITATFSGYYEIFTRNVIAISVNGKELRGPFFEESDLWRFGGTSTVRGYRENQFLASRIAWANLEYRLLLTRRSYIFTFLDTGYYQREANQQQQIEAFDDIIIGYGLGLTVDTAIGLLAVSFALAQGETFSEGKLHFGIVNEF